MKKNLRKTKEENTRRAEKKSIKQIFFIYCIVYSTLLLWKQMYGNHGQTIVKLNTILSWSITMIRSIISMVNFRRINFTA